jgi:hypothetical protein
MTAILGTAHIIRKVLQCEAWSVSGGDHRWFKRSIGEKRPVPREDNTSTNNNTGVKCTAVTTLVTTIIPLCCCFCC